MNLKDLLGNDYKEDLTHEQINELLASKKIVDLKSGRYVDKEKYTSLETSYNELKEGTKDYESLKQENEAFKADKLKGENMALLKKLGVKEEFGEFIISKLGGKVEEDKAKEFLKTNKQYLATNPGTSKIIDVVPPAQGGAPATNSNTFMNDLLRGAVNKNQE